MAAVNQMQGNGFRTVEEESNNKDTEGESRDNMDLERTEIDDKTSHVPTHTVNHVHISNGLPGNHANIPMNCRDCGRPISLGERFCTNCSKNTQ